MSQITFFLKLFNRKRLITLQSRQILINTRNYPGKCAWNLFCSKEFSKLSIAKCSNCLFLNECIFRFLKMFQTKAAPFTIKYVAASCVPLGNKQIWSRTCFLWGAYFPKYWRGPPCILASYHHISLNLNFYWTCSVWIYFN